MNPLNIFSYDAYLNLNLNFMSKKAGEYVRSIKDLLQKKGGKKLRYVIFTEYLNHFIDFFSKRGCLDEKDAELMKCLLSGNPLPDNLYIQWKKDQFSLLLFFFLADKLGYFNKPLCPTKLRRYYSDSEVGCSTLMINNFKTADGTRLTHYTNTKNWKLMHNAIKELHSKVAKEKDFIFTKGDNPYQKTILYCFDKGIPFTLEDKTSKDKTRGKIDTDMVDIVYEVWRKNKK